MYLVATRYVLTLQKVYSFYTVAIVVLILISGCSPSNNTDNRPRQGALPGEVRINLEKSDNRRLLDFYLGGMVSAESADPFSAGLVREADGKFYISKSKLARAVPSGAADLKVLAEDGEIDWEEFEAFVLANYYSYRSLPATIDDLEKLVGDWSDKQTWMTIPVKGVMSPYHRDVHVKYSAVYAALSGYREQKERMIFPVGTTFVSEHIQDNRRVELTGMRKRQDGFWDFFAYGSDEKLTTQIEKKPHPLDVPIKCVGCHFGTRLFEPEKSFPAAARTGPDGPRGIYIDEALPTAALVSALDEHRKRSDQILGLYGTLLLNKLSLLQNAGELDDEQARILDLFRDIL